MYYICIDHRNSLQTWSRSGGELLVTDGTYNYDFTNFPSSAFGNNLVLKGTKYCIYSGDVNKDGSIDLSDILLISNDASKFVTGYVNTDVDGNYISDLSDEIITYNNSSKFITVMNP